MAVGWQVILRLEDDRVITPTAAQRRVFADTVQRVGRRRRVFVFESPDTHAHAGAHCSEGEAKRLGHDLSAALTPALGHPVRFQPPRLTAIKSQWHLDNILDYVLGQKQHHGVGGDPLRESSNLPDLLGLRVTALWTAALVREILPRVSRERLLELLAVPDFDESWSLDLLAEAAASAAGLPTVDRRSARHVAAKAAAVRVADAAGCAASTTAEALGVTERAVRKLRQQAAWPALDQAIRRQMGLRLQLGERPTAFVRARLG